MFLRTLSCFFLTLSISWSEEDDLLKSIPLMEYLPNGTALTNVKIPSYDENLNPTSLLVASEIVIVDKDNGIMETKEMEVSVFSESNPYSVSLEKASFYYKNNYIESDNQVMIQNPQLALMGTGVFYDLKSRELFVKGPAKAIFSPKKIVRRFTLGLTTALALLPAQAEPPVKPTPEQLNELTEKSYSDNKLIDSEVGVVAEQQERLTQEVSASDEKLARFLKKTDQEDLLVQQKPVTNGTKLTAANSSLILTCEDGMYYDSENGHMVCLKNVKVEDPRFVLKCDDQLKVFLSKQDAEKSALGASEVNELLAAGNVSITYRGVGENKDIVATGGTAHYDVKTGEILIKASNGILPTVKQGNHFFEALEASVWVKISQKGFITGPGEQRTVYLPEE